MHPKRGRGAAHGWAMWVTAAVAAVATLPIQIRGPHEPHFAAAQTAPSQASADAAFGNTTFGDALAGLVQTLRTERGAAPLAREIALDRVAADQAAALALGNGVASDGATGDGARLRAAVSAAGWDAPPGMAVARAYAVRRSLEQAADWLASPENPEGAPLFDRAATALGAATAPLADGRIAWVVVVASGAPPPSAAQPDVGSQPNAGADTSIATVADAAPSFAVTALPAARGEAFGPALPDSGVPSFGDPLAEWTPALQDTARIVVVIIVGVFALTALRLRGGDRP